MLRDRQNSQLGFGDDDQGSFGAAENGIEVELSLRVSDMGKIIARQAAIELGKLLLNGRGIVSLQLIDDPVKVANNTGRSLGVFQLQVIERARGPKGAIGQDRLQFQNMITGFAV